MPPIRRRRSTDSRSEAFVSIKKRRKSLVVAGETADGPVLGHGDASHPAVGLESHSIPPPSRDSAADHANGAPKDSQHASPDVTKTASPAPEYEQGLAGLAGKESAQPTPNGAAFDTDAKHMARFTPATGPFETSHEGSHRLQWVTPLGKIYIDTAAERKASGLKKEELAACLDLIEASSYAHYKDSSIGWDPDHKKEELQEETFLFVRLQWCQPSDLPNNVPRPGLDFYRHHPPGDQKEWAFHQHAHFASRQKESEPIVGFVSWKVESEGDEKPDVDRPVTYIYELHLAPAFRSMGIGKELIKLVENMTKVQCKHSPFNPVTMLTVFNANAAAKKFYERFGYERHHSSPGPILVTRRRKVEADYTIMVKYLASATDAEIELYRKRRADASNVSIEKLHPWLAD
ncbi:hypothetical protein BS50DRAFT_575522 [Corynespora cassiicola Philippines]|uniref:N-alpha-acetyltransferase 40 n=1 Tax=Corynespora cassiicola Philippines TaxID=1448308 RepID=A0A2T2NJK6_CORCC|nr:hypothetical protein BS50DRAFT_575522 [Corynespora cassiicola Philippines]